MGRAPGARRNRLRFMRFASFFCVFLLQTAGAAMAQSQAAQVQSKAAAPRANAAATDKSQSSPDVVLSGHLSRDSVRAGEPVRFWLTIENRSDKPIEKLWLEHQGIHGFKLSARCWNATAAAPGCMSADEQPPPVAESCKPPANQNSADELCESLPGKESLTVWGDLTAPEAEDRQDAFLVVRWTRNALTSESAVPLGSIESIRWSRSIWLNLIHNWELGVPVWGGIFGGLIAFWKYLKDKSDHKKELDREARAKQAEDARNLKAKQDEDARNEKVQSEQKELDQRRNTWNLLMPEVHRMALDHYMPIASTVQGMILYLGNCAVAAGQTEENLLAAFCYTLRFHWRIRKMKRSGASWYFKNLTAEQLVVALVQRHRTHLGLMVPERQAQMDEFLATIKEKTTLGTTSEVVKNCQGEQKKFWDWYHAWARTSNAQDDVNILSILAKIINFETNRPYFYWYEERQPLVLSDVERRRLEQIGQTPDIEMPDLNLANVREYLDDATKPKKLTPAV
jgi:hypothetical protein